MSHVQTYEGTLDEIIARYGKELSGVHVKVIVGDAITSENGAVKSFYETATSEEWIEALRSWAASHDLHKPLLSDEATERESIYEGRGE